MSSTKDIIIKLLTHDNIFEAFVTNNLEIINIFLNVSDDLNIKINDKSLIQLAIEFQNVDCLSILLEKKINFTLDEYLIAIKTQNFDIMQLLLDNIHLTTLENQQLMLFKDSEYDNSNNVKIILDKTKLDINFKNNDISALSIAACNGNIETVKILLDNNADIDIQDSDGNTPLHLACIRYHIDTIAELLKYKPDLDNLKNNKGLTVLDLVQKINIPQIYNLFNITNKNFTRLIELFNEL